LANLIAKKAGRDKAYTYKVVLKSQLKITQKPALS
jgi:hypothetical protein